MAYEHLPTIHTTPRVERRSDEWWRGAVIYQVYPRSFADSNGDGIGDLQGITGRLDHIASLGVDAVWISPFMRSPQKDYGYDVEDYRDVDPMFGSLDDFDRLLSRAHALGLKVMIDFVPSHTSNRHPWFLESRSSRDNPKADWYVWADAKPDGTPPNNWLSVFGGVAWEWEQRRRQYYLHNFLKEQPDLNFHNPQVIDALVQQVQFWLDRGVDGLRIDAIDFGVHDTELRDNPPRPPDKHFKGGTGADNPFGMQLQYYNKARPELAELFFKPVYRLSERYPGRVLLGEISGDTALQRMGEYTEGGGLDIAYSFDLLSCEPTAGGIRKVVEKIEHHIGRGWACLAFSNHDVKRTASHFGGKDAPEALRSLTTIILGSLRGSICIYQGEELGLTEVDLSYEELRDPVGLTFWPDNKGRDGCRTPMPWKAGEPHAGFTTGEPWLPVSKDHEERARDSQEADPGSVLAKVRAFLCWRRQQQALRVGTLTFHDLDTDILAFTRIAEEQHLFCAFNLSSHPVEIALAGEPVDCPVATGKLAHGHLRLPAYGVWFGREHGGA